MSVPTPDPKPETAAASGAAQPPPAPDAGAAHPAIPSRWIGRPLTGHAGDEDIQGNLIVIEGGDGSGRSTQVLLLTEWLESEGFAVQTTGLRRSVLMGQNLDQLLASNMVNRLTMSMLYATDFYDQLEHRIIPALRAGLVVLADRYIYTLMARSVVRGLDRGYLERIYAMAMKPDLTVWLDINPEIAFAREFKKTNAISFWEAGLDLSLSSNLYESFILYQSRVRAEFEAMAAQHRFVPVKAEGSVQAVNRELRQRIAQHLGIKSTRFSPSSALASLWR